MWALEQTVRRRFGAQFAAEPQAAERRLAGFLARRGYDWDTIGRLARTLRDEAGDEDAAEGWSGPKSPRIP
jgi:SOS response regulatory protein OraA/RecX